MAGRTAGVLLVAIVVTVPPSRGADAQLREAEHDDTEASWILRAGVARHGLSDALASPLPYRGTGLVLGVGWGAPGRAGGWAVDVTYWGPRVASRIATDEGGFESTRQVDLGIVRLWPVMESPGRRVGLDLGGAFDVRFSFRTHHYAAPGWEPKVERFGDLLAPVQATARWTLRLGEDGLLSHRLSVPAVTVALRSPYTGLKYFPKATLEGPTAVTGLDSRLSYARSTGRGWLLGLFHHFTLIRFPDPRSLTSVVHRLGVEVAR